MPTASAAVKAAHNPKKAPHRDAKKKSAVVVAAEKKKVEEYNYPRVESGDSMSTPTHEHDDDGVVVASATAAPPPHIDSNTSNDISNSANETSPAKAQQQQQRGGNDTNTSNNVSTDVPDLATFEGSAAVVTLNQQQQQANSSQNKDSSPLLTSRSMRSGRSGSFREDSYYASEDNTRPLGTSGTRSFRSTAKRFIDPAAGPKLTSHIDALPTEATNFIGKSGPKASFGKAQDRFKVPDVATKDAQMHYNPSSPFGGSCTPRPGSEARRSPNRSRGSGDDSDSLQQSGSLKRGTSGILAGGGQRFREPVAATVEAAFADIPSTITTKRSFRTAQGLTAPRFGPAKVVENSQAGALQEAQSKVDFFVPAGFAEKTKLQATPSNSARGTMPNTKRFNDFREPITKDVDVAEDVVGTTTLLSKKPYTPGSSAFRSTAPRFTKTRVATQGGETFRPKGFVEEVLQK